MSLNKIHNIEAIPAFSLKIEYAESYGVLESNLSPRNLRSEWAFYVAKEVKTPFLIGNTVYLLNEGDVLMVPPFECIYPLERTHIFRYYRILLPHDLLSRLYPRLLARTAIRKNRLLTDKNVKSELFAICEELLCKSELSVHLIFSLLELFSKTDGSYTEKDEDIESYELCLPILLKKVMLYIKNHYKTPFTLEELANANGISSAKMSKLFKGHLGLSPKEYVMWVRMQAASELLFCKDTVESAAHALSYHDASRFVSDFKRTFGLLPSAFLKNGGYAENKILR